LIIADDVPFLNWTGFDAIVSAASDPEAASASTQAESSTASPFIVVPVSWMPSRVGDRGAGRRGPSRIGNPGTRREEFALIAAHVRSISHQGHRRRGGRNACAGTDGVDHRVAGDAHSSFTAAVAATMEFAMPWVAKRVMRMQQPTG
jgi:hypothetical protein